MTENQFCEIIERYKSPVIALIGKMVSSIETAQDISQDTFVRLWNYREKIKRDSSVFTLIYKIAVNLSIDYLRKSKPEKIEFDIVTNEYTDEKLETNEFYKLILKCSEKLKPKQKAVFIMRDIDGLSFEEIAEVLEMPVSNIRSNLHLARKNVRQLLQEKYNINQEYINVL